MAGLHDLVGLGAMQLLGVDGQFSIQSGLANRADPARILARHQEDRAAQRGHPHYLALAHQVIEFGRTKALDPRPQPEERRLRFLRLTAHAPVKDFQHRQVDPRQQELSRQQGAVPLAQGDASGHVPVLPLAADPR